MSSQSWYRSARFENEVQNENYKKVKFPKIFFSKLFEHEVDARLIYRAYNNSIIKSLFKFATQIGYSDQFDIF